MGNIIKMPDGTYGMFSSVVDNFVMYNCTPQDIVDELVKRETERITRAVCRQITESKPDDFYEVIETIAAVHGPDALIELAAALDFWEPSDSDLAWARKWNEPERDCTYHWEHEHFKAGIPPDPNND